MSHGEELADDFVMLDESKTINKVRIEQKLGLMRQESKETEPSPKGRYFWRLKLASGEEGMF